ncbi:cytochrome P450 [Phytomonospora sp. NPDC050363]|uniref:cytochrome P450 n=1 Tax=Phytomonospora sp. NPDC050363 TaxID=3155642 RepID=UPI0034085A00
MESLTVTDPAQITAVLDDERFTVVPPRSDETGGMAWVRRTVGRFTEGEAHRRRRAMAVAEIGALDPASLREEARKTTRTLLDGGAGLDRLADEVPVRVLATALGVTDVDAFAAAVPVVAAGYLTGSAPSAEVDAAVATLVSLLGPGDDEEVAARVSLPLQAHAATAKIIRSAVSSLPGARDAADALTRAFRHDPPVPALRRVTREETPFGDRVLPPGTPVVLDVSGGPEFAFGAGRRPCPGEAQAMAIATGVVEEVAAR